MKKIILMILLLPTLVFGNYTKQELLSIAFQEGKRIGYPNTVRAMLLQESEAGDLGRIHDNNTTFGVMCIKMSTAQDVLKICNKCHTYKNIRKQLETDDLFNIKVAVTYLEYLLKVFNGDIDRAILAYNVGIGRIRKHGMKFDPNDYLKKVRSKILVNKYCRHCNRNFIIA